MEHQYRSQYWRAQMIDTLNEDFLILYFIFAERSLHHSHAALTAIGHRA